MFAIKEKIISEVSLKCLFVPDASGGFYKIFSSSVFHSQINTTKHVVKLLNTKVINCTVNRINY